MTSRSTVRILRLALLPVLIMVFTVAIGTFFFLRADRLMQEQLRQRLQSTAAVAAQQFNAFPLETIDGPEDRARVEYEQLVRKLQNIRAGIPGIRYAYLVRQGTDENTVTFIADADEFVPVALLDRNKNGVLDDDERPGEPGEEYDISDAPAFKEAFSRPSVDHDFTVDQWGSVISGYAPVYDDSGRAIAVLGLDMSASEFEAISQSIFSPFGFLLVVLAGFVFAGYVFAIVQRRRLESMQQIEMERTALLDLATHQLGMPLATFRWWLELLREKDDGAICRDGDVCEQLQLGIDRMDQIVNALQETAHLQRGTMNYHAESTDMRAFWEEIANAAKPALHLKNQRVEIVAAEDLPKAAIDRALMSGVFSELIENARNYSPKDASIIVRLGRTRKMMQIEVEDRGCGIPAADLPHIFEKFRRAGNAHRFKPVGNGLGLYIAKGIIERAGGRITLKSREGSGTTITILLPLAS